MFERRFCEVLAPEFKYLWHCHLFTRGLTELAASATMILQTLVQKYTGYDAEIGQTSSTLAEHKKLVPAIIKQYIGHNFMSK